MGFLTIFLKKIKQKKNQNTTTNQLCFLSVTKRITNILNLNLLAMTPVHPSLKPSYGLTTSEHLL